MFDTRLKRFGVLALAAWIVIASMTYFASVDAVMPSLKEMLEGAAWDAPVWLSWWSRATFGIEALWPYDFSTGGPNEPSVLRFRFMGYAAFLALPPIVVFCAAMAVRWGLRGHSARGTR